MAPIDPTVLALLSIFGGVALTIIAGAVGALIQHRREHSKWLRDHRLRVYTEHLAATDNFLRAAHKGDVSEESAVASDAIRALSALQLVGPNDVYDAGADFQTAMNRTVTAYNASRSPHPVSLSADENAKAANARAEALSKAEDARIAARAKFLEVAQAQIGVS